MGDNENGLIQDSHDFEINQIPTDNNDKINMLLTCSRFELSEFYIRAIAGNESINRIESLIDQIKDIDAFTNQGEMLKKDMIRACNVLIKHKVQSR